jgi:hypothetical protein
MKEAMRDAGIASQSPLLRRAGVLYADFSERRNAPYNGHVQIGEGTHTVIMEESCVQLFQAGRQCLEEDMSPDCDRFVERCSSFSTDVLQCGSL